MGSVSIINTTTNTVIPNRVVVGTRPSGLGQFICSFNDSRLETMTDITCSSNQYLIQYLVGKPITLTSTVVTMSQETEIPSGKVTFIDGSNIIGNGSLSSRQATLETSSLSIGSHSIRARYMGDNNFRPSTSAPFQLTVGSNTFWPQIFSGIIIAFFGGAVTLFVSIITKRYLS